MMQFIQKTLWIVAFLLVGSYAGASQIITIKHSDGDMTMTVRKALEKITDQDVKLVFEKGTYKFLPDYTMEKYCAITNHGNGMKKIIFNFKGLHSVEIEGNGSEFIFHGQEMPFLFEGCDSAKVKNLTIDWDIPFTFLCKVVAVNSKEGWRDIKPFSNGFSWSLKDGRIEFPGIDGFNYNCLGSTLAFDPKEKRVEHGAWDIYSNPQWVEKRPNGILRIHERLKYYPPVGSLLSSKGDREHDRYAPAFDFKSSGNILIDSVVVHHALGMAFLFERSENIKLLNSGVYLREGTNRVVSSTADATHFCNCKGHILVENCRFENMLDDGTNVHGTYIVVDQVINPYTLRVELKHFEQLGFEFAGVGDEIWFIHQPSPERVSIDQVASIHVINERYIELRFKNELPDNLEQGDLLENKTWNPSFTMRNCIIRNNRARNVVLKTPLKIVIENNHFSSMMSSILFRGESRFWFESGAVEDVLIRNNTFDYCAYSGAEQAVLNISPRLGNGFDQNEVYDRNIRFEDNIIRTFDNRIVWGNQVDGLVIKGNTITQTFDAKPLYPNAPLFQFTDCKNVQLDDNKYTGRCKTTLVADQTTKPTLKVDHNTGF